MNMYMVWLTCVCVAADAGCTHPDAPRLTSTLMATHPTNLGPTDFSEEVESESIAKDCCRSLDCRRWSIDVVGRQCDPEIRGLAPIHRQQLMRNNRLTQQTEQQNFHITIPTYRSSSLHRGLPKKTNSEYESVPRPQSAEGAASRCDEVSKSSTLPVKRSDAATAALSTTPRRRPGQSSVDFPCMVVRPVLRSQRANGVY